ncbi:MAG: beta-N-acetylhexosaminidase [Vicinamibacterales bacterium]
MSLRTLRRQAGRLAIVGFTGQTVPVELRDLASTFDLGGVIYFARNVVEPRQVAELSREVADLAGEWPFWISVDQEGGRVARFRAPFTTWPPAITLGRSGDDALVARFGAALAAEVRAVGVNLDYVPVLDVNSNPDNPVIGDRALSEQAEDVARLGAILIEALQGAGVTACGKHFPGHGDTTVDSHEALPIVEHDRRRLDAVELVPFRRAIAAGVGTIMTAHVLVPPIDEAHPASLSPAIVTRLLKQELGFDGVVISDDLGMKAVSASMPLGEATVGAIAAGCDVVLLCNSTTDEQVAAIEDVIRAAEQGRITPARFDDALARQHRVKSRLLASGGAAAPDLGVIGCEAHQAIAREMAAWQ